MEIVKSKANKHIKLLHQLSTKKGRNKHSAFVLEGEKFAMAHSQNAELVLMSEQFYAKKGHSLACKQKVVVDNALFAQISDLTHSSGIMAIIKKPQKQAVIGGGVYLMLENIQDAGNMGAIFRVAFCSGVVSHIFLSNDCVDVYSQKVLRSSASFVLNMPFSVENLGDVVDKLKAEGVCIYASTPHSAKNLYTCNFTQNTAIIIGNEGQGISQNLLEKSDFRVKVPSVGESLNAANATAVMIYELYRQIKERN